MEILRRVRLHNSTDYTSGNIKRESLAPGGRLSQARMSVRSLGVLGKLAAAIGSDSV
jgi:hypothetical protein